MAPSAIAPSQDGISGATTPGKQQTRTALKLSGALEQFESRDLTAVIGTEFKNVQLVDWLSAPNSDELLRDLAITISQRNVVVFRRQDALDNDLQKVLVQRLGELSGKPSTSKLHIHPTVNVGATEPVKDKEISVIDSTRGRIIFKGVQDRETVKASNTGAFSRSQKTNPRLTKNLLSDQWHSDITFEPIPSDYAVLRLTTLPRTGGDTMFASGYDVYDRISPPFQKLLEGLTATYGQPKFGKAAAINGYKLYTEERGAPENVGDKLEAIHPVVRTNPVTGWKSIFAVGHHVQHINGVTEQESRSLQDWFLRLIVENHDLQVRVHWENQNDLVIWDNRSTYHAATPDYQGLGTRTGQRAVSLGERPYLDPASISRREDLAAVEGASIALLSLTAPGGDS
ncbi:Alpha-ketoglutarate-dependent taurine dioxygenase [Lachnellula subtilissima]|uniref:Alpha-ketoglutarate-dependent taurine dioxygenase n=1 Tax=Lachnellula subtilissima TaxID=602034 RepID=A0A8H8RSS7_9HELO|nr:Alpha-ketoglutarate-dependent taurine dioxygenase [Lachnellula subtilissima]